MEATCQEITKPILRDNLEVHFGRNRINENNVSDKSKRMKSQVKIKNISNLPTCRDRTAETLLMSQCGKKQKEKSRTKGEIRQNQGTKT